MLSALYAIARLSVTWVYQSKMVEVRIIKFLPYASPIPLVCSARYISSRNSNGFSPSGDVKQGWGKQAIL